MRFFIFSLMLAAAAHAITCTEGLKLYYKNMYSLFFNEDGAILDSSYISNLDGIFESRKLVHEEDRILTIVNSNEEGTLQSDTSLFFYLINDINSPADSSIAYSKSVIGDTTFIDAITDEPDDEDDPRISRQKIKLFKNGLINDSFEEGPGGTYEDHLCHEFYRVDHCFGESGCTDGNGNTIHNGDILQSYDHTIKETASGFVIEEFRSGKWTYQYFMRYTDGHTTSIAKRPAARMKLPSRNYFFDTKGRKGQKAIPYRVQF